MNIKIAVCDDELLERKLMEKQLERFLSSQGAQAELRFYDSGTACLAAMENSEEKDYPDLFLLDIYMEGQNGIELARRIRAMGAQGRIIFVTGGNEYASEAFEVGAFYYLQKPVRYEKLEELLNKVFQNFEHTRYLEVVVDRETKRVYVSDILWMETLNRKLTLYTDGHEYETYMSLREVLDILPSEQFVKVFLFAAVSLPKIESISGKNVLLTDGSSLALGEKFYSSVKEAYELFRERSRQMQ